MTPQFAIALLVTLVSALALNWGYVREHDAAGALPPLSIRRPLCTARRFGAATGVAFAAGMTIFHEPLPGGTLGALRVLSFVIVVASAVVLARRNGDRTDEPDRGTLPQSMPVVGDAAAARRRSEPLADSTV